MRPGGICGDITAYTYPDRQICGAARMGYRILYFYKKENAFYGGNAGERIIFDEREFGEDGVSLRVFFCALPEYEALRAGRSFSLFGKFKRMVRKRQALSKGESPAGEQCVSWSYEKLISLMRECCAHVSADAWYLEEHFGRELAERGFHFSMDRQRMCGELIGKLCGGLREIDSILYLGEDAEEQVGELPLPEKLLRKLRYFFYMGTDTRANSVGTADESRARREGEENLSASVSERRESRYKVLEENLWQEYGMPMLSVRKTAELADCKIGRLLVIDDRREGSADWEALPRGCAYLDLWSNPARRAQMGNRADIKYLSEYLYVRQNVVSSGAAPSLSR